TAYPEPAVGASFDPIHGILWYATKTFVWKGSTPSLSFGRETIASIDVDRSSGDLWILTDQHLYRYDSTGRRLFSKRFQAGVVVASDDAGGAWVAAKDLLERIDPTNNEVFTEI